MQKIFSVLCAMFFCFCLVVPGYSDNAPGGPMAGVEVAVGEYGNLGGIDMKVLNWGIIQEPPAKMFGLPFKKDKKDLIQIDVMFKNSRKQPIFLASTFLQGTLIGKNEEAIESDSGFFKEYGNMKKSFKHNLLPGQPVYGTFFFAADKELVPAKLVIREAGKDKVIRIFLQRNLPEEIIPGTARKGSLE